MRKFEFCLQLRKDMKTFITITQSGETGHDAYQKVLNDYPNWRVFCWGEFDGRIEETVNA